jgi:2-polyprenyl-3-methyl-5-hydroxy-6-metoxy-1,4-benzoquinol methylase
MANPEIVRIDFPNCLARQFPQTFSVAWNAIEDVVRNISNLNFRPLERRSPGLKDFNWEIYLRCSSVRMLRLLSVLTSSVPASGRVLDVGSYFGNFSLMCARSGYRVDALDSYRDYASALDLVVKLMSAEGIRILDFEASGFDLRGVEEASYEAAICAGVIEHVAHTPRPLLEGIHRILKPGGLLLLDTPNLAYIYNRQKLARGQSIFSPISSQYYTELPFEGHHREYTVDEIRWMFERAGFEDIELETFNYSFYGLPYLQGDDLTNFKLMEQDPSCRELILAVGRKTRKADCV